MNQHNFVLAGLAEFCSPRTFPHPSPQPDPLPHPLYLSDRTITAGSRPVPRFKNVLKKNSMAYTFLTKDIPNENMTEIWNVLLYFLPLSSKPGLQPGQPEIGFTTTVQRAGLLGPGLLIIQLATSSLIFSS